MNIYIYRIFTYIYRIYTYIYTLYIYILLSYISLAYHVHIFTTRSPPDNPLMGMDHGLLVGKHHQSWHGGSPVWDATAWTQPPSVGKKRLQLWYIYDYLCIYIYHTYVFIYIHHTYVFIYIYPLLMMLYVHFLSGTAFPGREYQRMMFFVVVFLFYNHANIKCCSFFPNSFDHPQVVCGWSIAVYNPSHFLGGPCPFSARCGIFFWTWNNGIQEITHWGIQALPNCTYKKHWHIYIQMYIYDYLWLSMYTYIYTVYIYVYHTYAYIFIAHDSWWSHIQIVPIHPLQGFRQTWAGHFW